MAASSVPSTYSTSSSVSSEDTAPVLSRDKTIHPPHRKRDMFPLFLTYQITIPAEDTERWRQYMKANAFPAGSFHEPAALKGSPFRFICQVKKKGGREFYLIAQSIFESPRTHVLLGYTLKGKVVALKLTTKPVSAQEKKVCARLRKMKKIERKLFVFGPTFKVKEGFPTPRYVQVLPYIDNTLVDWCNAYFDQNEDVPCAHRTAQALSYLHRHGIVHRDIKLENMLVKSGEQGPEFYIADFGMSVTAGKRVNTAEGSYGYLDPFLFRKPFSPHTEAAPEQDVWAWAMSLSVLANSATFQYWTKQMPPTKDLHYLADMREDSFSWYKQEHFPEWNNPSHLNAVLYDTLKLERSERPTAQALVDRIRSLPHQ